MSAAYWDESMYAEAEREARADWQDERPDAPMTRAEADEDAERPWSRDKWQETGNGYY